MHHHQVLRLAVGSAPAAENKILKEMTGIRAFVLPLCRHSGCCS